MSNRDQNRIGSKNLVFLFVFIFSIFLNINMSFSFAKKDLSEQIKVSSDFNSCPGQPLGRLTMRLFDIFKKNHSLFDIKNFIEDMKGRYYLSDYSVKYSPIKNKIKFEYKCPLPLYRLNYMDKNLEADKNIFVANGNVYNNSYAVLLKNEGKIDDYLSVLSVSSKDIKNNKIVSEILAINKDLLNKSDIVLSELIIENLSSIAIYSYKNSPVSLYLGKSDWGKKIEKSIRVINKLASKGKIPKKIYMKDSEKIIVKF